MATNRRRPSAAAQQHLVEDWNRQHAIGARVLFLELLPPLTCAPLQTRTVSAAQLLGGHTAVVFLEGKRGCVALDHCTPLAAETSPCP